MEKTLEAKLKAKRESGRERVQRFRNELYNSNTRHEILLEKDRIRWKNYYKNIVKVQDPEQRREKERIKKQRQRAAAKEKKANEKRNIGSAVATDTLNDAKKVIKSMKRQQTRKITKKVRNEVAAELRDIMNQNQSICEESSSSIPTPSHETSSKTESSKLTVSNSLWGCLTPKTKRKVRQKLSLSVSPGSGLRKDIQKEIGVNLSKKLYAKSDTKSDLAIEVEKFFYREDVTQLCPDLKKCKKDPDTGEDVQLRYRRCSLLILYAQFTAEVDIACSEASFKRYVPFNVIKPKPQELGTCLCAYCLNPELKYRCLMKLIDLKEEFPQNLDDNMNDEKFPVFQNQLNDLKNTKKNDVTYMEWMKVDVPSTKSNNKQATKASRKIAVTESFGVFIEKFMREVVQYKQHLERVHAQFKGFKEARIAAQNPTNKTATVHVDWSENARVRQIEEARDGYYYEDHISIQAIHTWIGDEKKSSVSLSDDTSHGAAAVIASIGPKLEDLVEDEGVTTINIISDSPVTQFRNKSMFWFMKTFSERNNVNIKWIFLESGHGKGIPDGIGAVTKRAIATVLMENPEKSFYTVNELIDAGLEERLPTYDIYIHTNEAIESCSKMIPTTLLPVTDTFKIHEVYTVLENGVSNLYHKFTSTEEKGNICDIMGVSKKRKRKARIEKKESSEELMETDSDGELGKSKSRKKKVNKKGKLENKEDKIHKRNKRENMPREETEESSDDEMVRTIRRIKKEKVNEESKSRKMDEEDKKIRNIRKEKKEKQDVNTTLKEETIEKEEKDKTARSSNGIENKENEKNAGATIDFNRVYSQTDFDILATDDWVLVNYFGTYHIGKVIQVSSEHNCAKVRCLDIPYNSPFESKPSTLEPESSSVWYTKDKIFQPPMKPQLKDMKDVDGSRGFKYILVKE